MSSAILTARKVSGRGSLLGIRPTARSGSLDVRLVDAAAHEIASTWQQVERRVECDGLANSWTWTELWLRHYGDLVPHRFVIAERDGPCAIALLTHGVGKRRGPFPIRTLHLGTAGEPDAETVRVQYNRLLVSDAERVDFARGIMDVVKASGKSWDEFHLDGFDPDEAAPFLLDTGEFIEDRKVNYVTELAAARAVGKSVLESLDSHAAKKIRRSIRQIEQAYGPISVEVATSLAEAHAIYDEMVTLHQARWRADSKPGVFASARFAGFNRDMVDALFPAGNVWLARARAGDVTLGCDYSFIERNRVLAYQWGIALLPDPRPSPGLVTSLVSMEAAMARGLHEYDWLAGDVFYKRQLSTTARELIWACKPRGLRINGIYALERAGKTADRLRAQLTGEEAATT